MVKSAWLLLAVVACGGASSGPRSIASGTARTDVSFVTLYRDAAVVRQRVEVTVPESGSIVLPVAVPVGLDGTTLYVADTGSFTSVDLRTLAEPGKAEVTVTGAGAGAFYLGYQTNRLAWSAEYTLVTTGARDRSLLRGALAVRNSTGVELSRARVTVVDGSLGSVSTRKAELLREQYAGIKPGTATVAEPREVGVADLAAGETRIDLLGEGVSQAMVSTLVYDPIGSELNHPGDMPDDDPAMGVTDEPRPRVSESLELTRDPAVIRGLPGGAVRLFERKPDGSLVVLGEARMFDASTRKGTTDTVAIGTAIGVTGRREQRDFDDDEDRRRLTEEFRITLTNERDYPVEVVVREHPYRMETWNIAFASHSAKWEASQQFAMRVKVPPHGTASATYVVVYPWKQK